MDLAQLLADQTSFPSMRSALTHPSSLNATSAEKLDFQRLELLGDAVLDLVVTEMLMDELPGENEGGLTVRRAKLVHESNLANWAKRVHLEYYLGPSSSPVGVTNRILADVVEAIVGAVYRDTGSTLQYVRLLVESDILRDTFTGEVEQITPSENLDGKWNAKGDLQAMVIKRFPKGGVDSLKYTLLETKGPPHCHTFVCAVSINGQQWGKGEARTKKEAEKLAAQQAIKSLTSQAAPAPAAPAPAPPPPPPPPPRKAVEEEEEVVVTEEDGDDDDEEEEAAAPSPPASKQQVVRLVLKSKRQRRSGD